MTDAQVPVQAQVLLLTRLPYLTEAQRTDVLATTALPSGYPLLNGNTWDGWGQLNLVAAAGGYGAFNSTVTVRMDASQGGYNAADTWTNDITGAGGLIKQGTGQLTLTGANSFAGGTTIQGGVLVAASQAALGTGDVNIAAATLVDAAAGATVIGGSLIEMPSSMLEFDIGGASGGVQELLVDGSAAIAGGLTIDFLNDLLIGNEEDIILSALGGLTGDFQSLVIDGISVAYTDRIIRTANGYELAINAVPEPSSLLLLTAGLAALSRARRTGGPRNKRR